MENIMNHTNLVICKSNKVIEAGYKLTLNEQRVVLACVGQVNSTRELSATDEFELSAKDFAQLFSVSEDNAYQALLDVAKSLFNRYIVVDSPYPDRPKVKRLEMRWISSIKHLPDDGKVILMFAQDIVPFLSEIKRTFTSYKLEHIGKMTSIYAIRLYELLMQWQSTGKREVDLDWLKKQFQIEEGYDRMSNFKARVLDPAIKDINDNSNLSVEWTQRKTGRRVTHLIFTFSEKQLAKPVTTKRLSKKELEQRRLAEQLKIEQQQRAELVQQQCRERQRQSLSDNLSKQFSRQAREDFIASMDKHAQQQLVADILEEAQQFDDYLVTNIKKKGLNCIPAYFLITKRIPNFAERKAVFIAQQLKLNGF
jgi:plasmid replication initiation protein